MTRLVSVLVIQEAPCVTVTTVTYVTRERTLFFFQGHVRWPVITGTGMRRQLIGGDKGLSTFFTFEVLCSSATPSLHPLRHVLFEVWADVVGQLPLYPEAFSTVLAAVLLQCEVNAQVVLHGQLVGVGVVTNRAVIFTCLVRVLVVDQTSSVAVGPPTLVARIGAGVTSLLRFDPGLGLRRIAFPHSGFPGSGGLSASSA